MYTKEWDYKVTLTVVTENISVFSRTKNLVLTSAPQTVKIKSSLKKSVSGQSIDFSSEWSQGQVSNYYWDFGDWESSTLANPTHVYTKSGKYKVILKLEFVATKRILEDSIEIEIY
jgi:PKD repeat protein